MKIPEGPSVAHLTKRLIDCPPDYLEEPVLGDDVGARVDAVVADLMLELSGELPAAGEVARFGPESRYSKNQLKLVLVACWLLGEPEFRTRWAYRRAKLAAMAKKWLEGDLLELGSMVHVDEFIIDSERRVELSRLALKALGFLPKGESQKVAQDRLTMVDSLERKRVLAQTKERVERAEELRKKLAEQRAREAASRYTRE